MKNYLRQVGLEKFENVLTSAKLNSFVSEAFSRNFPALTTAEVSNLYHYKVPKLGEDGTCNFLGELEDEPYNLVDTLGLDNDIEDLKNSRHTLRLWQLYQVVQKVMESVTPDWFGIYRQITNSNGEEILLKEAYMGKPSRAEFPLNEDFARRSNNSTVGLTGKAVYFNDLLNYDGPYYECDNKVQSEYCCPIIKPNGEIIGIVDAESFQKDFFQAEKILQLTKVCQDLGKINLGL